MNRPVVWAGGALLLATAGLLVQPGEAQPPGPGLFCDQYPNIPACASGEVSCTVCHTAPPALNVYGADVSANLLPDEERPLHVDLFSGRLGDALVAIEDLDSDGDGVSNIDELAEGTSPSDPESVPGDGDCLDDPRDGYDLCGVDPAYVFKKVHLDFCGRSPTLAEKNAFRDIQFSSAILHDALDACLDSEHWRGKGGEVWNLANRKIGPLQAVKAGLNSGPIPLADYDDDYAFWVWTQTDGRDVRQVLTGKSFVRASYEDGQTVYTEWDRDPEGDFEERGEERYQGVDREHRAGLLTHRWFLMSNTMFTGVPRTTAAQAYRGFLGYDIARLEGLRPVSGEPIDYDSKGVGAEGCAVCHSTLDPLTYPFSRYEGIDGGNAPQYGYSAERMQGFVRVDGPLVADTPEQGVLFGQPVNDLVEWGEVAANSDAFRRAAVLDYWRMLLGEDPRPTEQQDFGALVDHLGETWDIESMLHELIDTEAYGAP